MLFVRLFTISQTMNTFRELVFLQSGIRKGMKFLDTLYPFGLFKQRFVHCCDTIATMHSSHHRNRVHI